MLNNSKEKIWRIKEEPSNASKMAKCLGISRLLASLLINRGLNSADSARSFLNPRLKSLRDPFLLKDMDRSVEIAADFVYKGKMITVYGDYDADGLTASALLVDFFSRLGAQVSFYIPDRLKEGYGLNEQAIRKIASSGTGLIITVDCGTGSLPEISLARKLGMEVIVTDHHKIPGDFRAVCPTVNPLRPDSSFPFRGLAGVGVAFYLSVALRSFLRNKGFFRLKEEPDLREYLDLVAIGTVADIVPLIEENRVFVKEGINRLQDGVRPGIKELIRVSGISRGRAITAYDVAFTLAPRLNAMGRLGPANRAVHLLVSDNEREASIIASQADSLNSRRQAIENRIISESRKRIECMEDLDGRRTIVLSDPGWHRGVVGIVASRIVEEFYRPTFILNAEGDLLQGSGRSIEGFDLYQALSGVSDLLEHFGGHDYAAGVTLESSNIRDFCFRFEELAKERLRAEDMIPKKEADARLCLGDITPQTIREIEMLSPFGHKNPRPLFWAGPLKVVNSRIVGKNHLRLKMKERRVTFEGIAFRSAALHPLEDKSVEILFHLETSTWNGMESIQLVVNELRINGD